MTSRLNFSASEWRPLPSNQDSFSHINTRANYSGRDPFSISFQCTHNHPDNRKNYIHINQNIFNIFKNALVGNAHLDMRKNPSHCPVGEKRHCGNVRGYLWECRCDDLDRINKPIYRTQFENDVISMIINHQNIQHAQRFNSAFQFNLAIFCPGGLLGEEILLFRLFDSLRRMEVSGEINLFFIDREYTAAISSTNPDNIMSQFLKEICGCLPPNLKVKGTFFGEADHYIQMASVNDEFKHDLLIAADPEGAETYMGKLSQASISQDLQPIALVRKTKSSDKPSICNVNQLGDLENCYVPYEPSSLALAFGFWGSITLIAIVIILAVNIQQVTRNS